MEVIWKGIEIWKQNRSEHVVTALLTNFQLSTLAEWHFWTHVWNSKNFLAERLFLKCYEDDIYKKYS